MSSVNNTNVRPSVVQQTQTQQTGTEGAGDKSKVASTEVVRPVDIDPDANYKVSSNYTGGNQNTRTQGRVSVATTTTQSFDDLFKVGSGRPQNNTTVSPPPTQEDINAANAVDTYVKSTAAPTTTSVSTEMNALVEIQKAMKEIQLELSDEMKNLNDLLKQMAQKKLEIQRADDQVRHYKHRFHQGRPHSREHVTHWKNVRADLTNALGDLKSKITASMTKITTLKAKLAAAETTLTDHETKLSQMKKDIADMKAKANAIKDPALKAAALKELNSLPDLTAIQSECTLLRGAATVMDKVFTKLFPSTSTTKYDDNGNRIPVTIPGTVNPAYDATRDPTSPTYNSTIVAPPYDVATPKEIQKTDADGNPVWEMDTTYTDYHDWKNDDDKTLDTEFDTEFTAMQKTFKFLT